ncbi:FAD-binding oxidoreductase [Pelagibius sp. Alg239-R121]|uniref:NAD(P)/FAD-dependent oxidoreductase n=1 Tax=Pelagibius sp. Alg239-R121 TaxID=2993448 RepID=UPI0024A769E4|nr:FAD-binding oxidoreductase [Pelagibius sp. Alg239-R121]
MISDNTNTHGLWAATAPAAPPCPALDSDEDCDVAVVGAGYTGMSAALHLAEAGKNVRVLDSHEPGWGCSGRNGGQINPGWKLDLDEIARHYGDAWKDRAIGVAKEACGTVFELIDRHKIDCQAVRSGYVQGGVGKRGLRQLQQRCELWQSVGKDARLLNARESADLLGTEAYDACMQHPDGGNLQPLSYARGLTLAAQSAGTLVHGNSAAISIEPMGQDWRVRTTNGTLTARHVVIGTNGYTDNLWPGLKKAVVPVASVLTATEPLSDNLRESILPALHSVSETIRIQVYYRLDNEGRFVIGGAGPVWQAAEQGSTAACRAMAERYFPALKGVKWIYDWAGYPAMTWDKAPKLMQLAPGVLAGMGYNGRGIAMATMMGKQLAREITGEGADLPVTALYQTPFHALHKFGIFATVTKGRVMDRFD